MRGQLSPFPSPADAGFLLAIPLEIAAVLHFFEGRGGPSSRLRITIDGLLLASGLFFVSWVLILHSTIQSSSNSAFETALSLAYPVGDIVTLVVVLATVTEARQLEGPLTYVTLGLIALTVSDSTFTYLNSTNSFSTNPIDTGWVAGFLLLGVGALRAQVRSEMSTHETRFSSARALLPYAPLVGALGIAGFQFFRGQQIDPIGSLALGSMIAMVLVRQLSALDEVRTLTLRLEDTVTELRAREDELTFQAFHDPLTKLANRALLRDRLEHSIAIARRTPGSVALLFLDLDDFKTVNDTLGHDAGDQLLAAVGERLRACVRPGDTTARLGGDEFAVLLAGSPEPEEVTRVATRILDAFAVPFSLEQDFTIGISIGIVMSNDLLATGVDLLRRADVAMYTAKDAGKNRYAVFGEEKVAG